MILTLDGKTKTISDNHPDVKNLIKAGWKSEEKAKEAPKSAEIAKKPKKVKSLFKG